ncbi:MAG: OB-fold nucleic acid binding domain-containing protein [Methanimicrococcus sp.]|nr:OB-fold nucleic acid binding domain-containing protein [Methanimicrococcus sp.]
MTELKNIYEKVRHLISYEDFLAKVEERKEALGGLCDDEMCARLVLNDLGVSSTEREVVTIDAIDENSGNISFVAKILAVYDPREFSRNDGTVGRVSNVMVGDATGKIRVSVWDSKVDAIANGDVKVGMNVAISGYTKKGLNGVEVHVGNNGVFAQSDEDVTYSIPTRKISDIKDGMNDITLLGEVLDLNQIKTFSKKDGGEGRVSNITIGDDTGTIRVSLWDDKAEFVNILKIGNSVKIQNAYSKTNNFSQKVEMSLGNSSVIEIVDEDAGYEQKFLRVDEITDGMNGVNLSGVILDISDVRTFNKKDGSEGTIGTITVGDSTGKIRVTLWDDKTVYLDEFDFDETVDILNAYSRINNFSQQVELNVGNRGNIVASDKKIQYQEKLDNINDILPGKSYSVQGRILEIGELREFNRDDGTQSTVSNIELEDDTGRIRVSLWGEHADIVNSVQIGMTVRIIDAFSKFGMNEEIELSAGNKTRVIIL